MKLVCTVCAILICYIQAANILSRTRLNRLPFLNKLVNSNSTTVRANEQVNQTKSDFFQKVDAQGEVLLNYYGVMLAGAIARSASATAVHPLNVIKIMLQTKAGKMPDYSFNTLTRGAGSQFIMSVPHGALSFGVIETTKKSLKALMHNSTVERIVPSSLLNPIQDFMSSSLSTFICSIVSTPQMVITDRIMAGVYPNFITAIISIFKNQGLRGFYTGWFPALAQKIPSYALTWMFFQQLKQSFISFMRRRGTTIENTLIGCLASAAACCVMIPVDTIKTRIVTQNPLDPNRYMSMWDCLSQILKHEGVWSLYKSLPPRLLSVVPMTGIQFGVYELMKRLLLGTPPPTQKGSHTKAVDKVTHPSKGLMRRNKISVVSAKMN